MSESEFSVASEGYTQECKEDFPDDENDPVVMEKNEKPDAPAVSGGCRKDNQCTQDSAADVTLRVGVSFEEKVNLGMEEEDCNVTRTRMSNSSNKIELGDVTNAVDEGIQFTAATSHESEPVAVPRRSSLKRMSLDRVQTKEIPPPYRSFDHLTPNDRGALPFSSMQPPRKNGVIIRIEDINGRHTFANSSSSLAQGSDAQSDVTDNGTEISRNRSHQRLSEVSELNSSPWMQNETRKDSLMVYRRNFLRETVPGMPNTVLHPQRTILKKGVAKHFKSFTATILSCLYGMVLLVLGAVIPLAEVSTNTRHSEVFQAYYIYLYAVSISFLAYLNIYILRQWRLPRLRRPTKEPSTNDSAFPEPDSPTTLLTPLSHPRRRNISQDLVSSTHAGSFYLRLGAVGFGAGCMILDGLHLGEFYEKSSCEPPLTAFRHTLHLLFTFIQLCFVFLNTKTCINRFKSVAKFGIMHMLATNMCVWVRVIVEETIREIDELRFEKKHSTIGPPSAFNGVYNDTVSDHKTGCLLKPTPVANVVHAAVPYLYPCVIEYSLISAGILYVVWKNIGRLKVAKHQSDEHKDANDDDNDDDNSKTLKMSVDCSNSSRGLFLGIVVLVGSVISMIVFFVFVHASNSPKFDIEGRLYFKRVSVYAEHLTEIAIYIMASIAVVVSSLQMHSLRFNAHQPVGLEETLILFPLVGEYIFGTFSIIAATFDTIPLDNNVLIVSTLFGMFQATAQSIFICNGLRRSPLTSQHRKQKPGKHGVMFLLMCNISLWCISTFEVMRADANPVQIHYYGPLAWNIFMHISLPLIIFYRFHSTVCLSNIWKKAWKEQT